MRGKFTKFAFIGGLLEEFSGTTPRCTGPEQGYWKDMHPVRPLNIPYAV
jgi:hypothetical protein